MVLYGHEEAGFRYILDVLCQTGQYVLHEPYQSRPRVEQWISSSIKYSDIPEKLLDEIPAFLKIAPIVYTNKQALDALLLCDNSPATVETTETSGN